MGNISPRSLQFVPGFGIMRLSHLGFAVTDGINDKLENPEALRPYLFGGQSDISPIDWNYIWFAKAAQTANPPMYCCAVPVLPTTIAVPAGILAPSAAMSGGGGLPSGTYLVKAILVQKVDGKQIAFSEIAASGTGTTLTVTLPTHPSVTGAYWIVYFGLTPGAENQFLLTGPTQTTLVITSAGISGTPGSSNGWLTRIFCYDLVLKSWAVIDLPFPISVLRQFRALGTIPITVMGGFWDSGVRRWQAMDPSWDAGATNSGFQADTNVAWSVRDAEVFDEGGTKKLFGNQVILRGDGNPSSISMKLAINGQPSGFVTASLIVFNDNNMYEARQRIFQAFENMHIDISGTGPASVESIGYELKPKPVGAALVYS
jgi:hypothetical protein